MNNKCLPGPRRRAEGRGACALVSSKGATVDLIIFFLFRGVRSIGVASRLLLPSGSPGGGGARAQPIGPLRVNSMSSRAAPQEVAADTAGAVQQERGPTGAFPLVLKKLMENPPRDSRLDKEKKEKLEEDEAAAASTMAVSASLMPPIWDKTIPYDGESFHLEYMDLDEFLLENGIPSSPAHLDLNQNPLLPVAELEGKEPSTVVATPPASSSTVVFNLSETTKNSESSPDDERLTPSPVDPDCVEIDVNFNPDPADLVLSSVPGGELFNPRKHKFAEEDLKPQPMIKKAKKVFVPDDQKDEKYWTRRKKNNVAAKRSRDARRLKENQITIRAAFLEKENTALRTEVAELRKEVGKCKNIVSKYESRYGSL
ncbi:thyrotroph embryonic factor isoform X2 [Thamnophis elegans]|uniref:thyrotroph embryonic factor isoform X2 n=1 Tax=Thamnophis elegans TaxID=35005 RepID=UPI001378997A|nr:thyrotroph embryonic factor isoform X2 [Thamnophis elegans]